MRVNRTDTMNLRPLLIPALALIVACGQAPGTADGTAPRTVTEVAIASGTPMSTADLSISGMTCEMMCGGAIKDAMAKLKGVSGTEIKFTDKEGEASHALVTYDPREVSDAEMVKAIQALHEGQYKVLAIAITNQVVKEGAAEKQEGTEPAAQVNASALTDVVVPSLLSLLQRLVQL